MKTLLPNKDYILLDGEIYILSMEDIKEGDRYFFGNRYEAKELTGYVEGVSSTEYYKEQGVMKITHSTASLQGVKQLDRSLFVKGVDVEELANSANGYSLYCKETKAPMFNEGFKAGYNANKNEFTREEVESLLNKAINDNNHGRFFYIKKEIDTLRPLSLPSSIIIEGEEITKINW